MLKLAKTISLILIVIMVTTIIPAEPVFATTKTKGYDGYYYTHNSKFDTYTKINGLDISEWQGVISTSSYKKMKSDGISYVILRCGFTGSSSYKCVADACFEANYANARAAGLSIGVYYYSLATTTSLAKKEAKFVLNSIKGKKIAYPAYTDIEDPGAQGGASKTALANVANTFCSTVKAAGHSAGVYASLSWLDNKIGKISSGNHIWCAQYYYYCQYEGSYSMWQYTSDGRVYGYSGRLDCNFYYSGIPTIKNFHCYPYNYNSNIIKWSKSNNSLVKYQLYRSTDKKNWKKLGTFKNSATTYVNSKLKHNVKYYYKMRPIKVTSSKTIYGRYTSIGYACPRVPEVTKFTTSVLDKSSIKLTWNKSINANVRYWVYRKSTLKPKWGKPIVKLSRSKTSYIDKNLKTHVKYYYKVHVVSKISNKNYFSSPSKILYGLTRDVNITGFKSKATNINTCLIEWNEISCGAGYQLYRSTNKKDWKLIKKLPHGTTSYKDTNLKCDTKYYYKMRSVCKVDGKCYYSKFSKIDYGYPRVSEISGFKSYSQNCHTSKVIWNKSSHSDYKYALYRKDGDNGTWRKIKVFENSTTLFKETDLTPNIKYYYKMRTMCVYKDKTYYSAYTKTDYAAPKVPEINNLSTQCIDKKYCLINWDKVNDSAIEYLIYRSNKPDENWKVLKRLDYSTVSYTDKSVVAGSKYYYKMRVVYKTSEKSYYGKYTNAVAIRIK